MNISGPTNLSDHRLEDVTAADGLEDFVRDALGNALQTLLHESFTLKNGNRSQTEARPGELGCNPGRGRVEGLTSVLKVAAAWRNSSQISCIPSVSQVEFSRQEKNPQPTATAPFKHLATSAAAARSEETFYRETFYMTNTLHFICQGCFVAPQRLWIL